MRYSHFLAVIIDLNLQLIKMRRSRQKNVRGMTVETLIDTSQNIGVSDGLAPIAGMVNQHVIFNGEIEQQIFKINSFLFSAGGTVLHRKEKDKEHSLASAMLTSSSASAPAPKSA